MDDIGEKICDLAWSNVKMKKGLRKDNMKLKENKKEKKKKWWKEWKGK